MEILAVFNTIAIFVLPLLCITALIIMSVKHLPEYYDEKKARLMKIGRNTLTGVLIVNYTLDIVLACMFIFNIPEAFNISTSVIYDMEVILARVYFGFGVVSMVGILMLFCNLIQVIAKKTEGSWKRSLTYILICSFAVLSNAFMCLMLFFMNICD